MFILSIIFGLTLFNISNALNISEGLSPLDPASFARPEFAIIRHVSITWNVSFEDEVLDGSATIYWNVLQDIDYLILDVSSLNIESIESQRGNNLDFEITDHVPEYGSKLTVSLDRKPRVGDTIWIRIKYTTSPNASALIWLHPNQTSSRTHPYVFSQCVPIHARSILPCQDTPSVKFTFDAIVNAPEGFTPLVGALHWESGGHLPTFRQPFPIPSYLLAFSVGVLENRDVGPRSRVWSEPADIEQCAWEFAETETYIQAAERICGPYEYSQYDLLILPQSFSYGGMENPMLTFVSPTVLAGDRSLVRVIMHEIVHSWTGNLVSIRNFGHFWLKESFTVFLERKINGYLIEDREEGKRTRDFQSLLGLRQLRETIDQLGSSSPLTRLVIDLSNAHPRDSITTVPYEKGSLFLRYIEDLVGGPEIFDNYVMAYILRFRRRSIDTSQWKQHLLEYFEGNEGVKEIDWDTWLYGTGMPPIIPRYDETLALPVTTLADSIANGTIQPAASDVTAFTPQQLIFLLQELLDRPPVSLELLRAVDSAYGLSTSRNAEILYRWWRLSIMSQDIDHLEDVFSFLNRTGRLSYVRPLYRALYAWEAVRGRALRNFVENEPFMMAATATALREDLHLN